MIWRLIADPRLFPVVIMVLFACAAARYAVAGNLWQTIYWLSALHLNVAVFFMGPQH